MSTEIAPLQSVQENIKNRIKSEFMNLIPDEMWSAMVASVMKDFTEDTSDRSYSQTKMTPSPLKRMIREEIEAIARKHLQDELARLDTGTWDGYGAKVAGDAVKKLVAENFPVLLAGVQGAMVEMAVMSAVSNIRNSMQRF